MELNKGIIVKKSIKMDKDLARVAQCWATMHSWIKPHITLIGDP